MTQNTATVERPNASDALRAVLLADFSAMRSEITTLLSLQGQFLSMSVGLFGVLIGLQSNKEFGSVVMSYASLAAVPFLILGFLYADSSARIMRVARYINLRIRPELVNIAGTCLSWEDYIRQRPPGHKLTKILDYLRLSFFVGPAGYFTWHGFIHTPAMWWFPILRVVDGLLILIFIGVMIYVTYRLSGKVRTA